MKKILIIFCAICLIIVFISCKKEKSKIDKQPFEKGGKDSTDEYSYHDSHTDGDKKNEDKKDSDKEISEFRFVWAKGGLRLRKNSTLKSKIVTLLPNGSKVGILEEKGKILKIAGKKGKWTKVKYKKHIGWAFGGFIIKEKIYVDKGVVQKVVAGPFDFTIKLRKLDKSIVTVVTSYKKAKGYISFEEFSASERLMMLQNKKISVVWKEAKLPCAGPTGNLIKNCKAKNYLIDVTKF